MLDLHRRAEMKTLFLVTVPEEDPLWIPSVPMGNCSSLEKDHTQTLPKVPISSRGIIRRPRLLWEYQDVLHRTNQNPLRKVYKTELCSLETNEVGCKSTKQLELSSETTSNFQGDQNSVVTRFT